MSDLISTIKELAHEVSEDYLLTNKDMNDSLVELFRDGEIENDEVLKRICEHANQNVYLALFNDPETDKGNITFDMAESDKVLKEAKESEDSMKNYSTPPSDYRSDLEIVIMPKGQSEETEGEKLASFNTAIEYKQVLKNLLSKVETMKTASVYNAENAYNRMAHDAKVLIANGDSIGDLSKIATRYVKENLEGDFIKVAKCYDMIHKELKNDGFHVRTGFTKISSQRINSKSDVLKPVYEFATSIAKVAGFGEMEQNIKSKIAIFDKSMKESRN